jgi:hypothetical protein
MSLGRIFPYCCPRKILLNWETHPKWETLPNWEILLTGKCFPAGKCFPTGKCFPAREHFPKGKCFTDGKPFPEISLKSDFTKLFLGRVYGFFVKYSPLL